MKSINAPTQQNANNAAPASKTGGASINDADLPKDIQYKANPVEALGNSVLSQMDSDLFSQMSEIEKSTTLLTLELRREKIRNEIEAQKAIRQKNIDDLARQKEEETGEPAMALELPNGEMVTGKTSDLFGPTAALLINAIKKLAHIDKETKLIEPEYVQPIQGLKINHLGSRNPRLHSNEILIALAITAANNADAARAMEELGNLKGSEAHSTIILTDEDKNVLRKLGINVTFDPYYQYDKLYRK